MLNSKSRAGFGLVCVALLASSLSLRGSGISKPVPAYSTVEDEAAPLTQRGTLNMVGAGVTCVDDVPNTRTNCTIPGGGPALDAATDAATPFNTRIGHQTLNGLTTGINLTAGGYQSLLANTEADGNSAYGFQSLMANTTGAENSAFGYRSLYSNILGEANVAVGFDALFSNLGYSNVAVGNSALFTNSSGFQNVGIGVDALFLNDLTHYNTAVGNGALYNNVVDSNSAVGFEALYSNTTGYGNTALGSLALHTVTVGNQNSAVGQEAQETLWNGWNNAAFGYQALHLNSVGSSNTALGSQSLLNCNFNSNTAVGYEALRDVTSEGYNTAVGKGALVLTTGAGNIAMGYLAADSLTTGSYNLIIGYQTEAPAPAGDNQLNIGDLIRGDLSADWHRIDGTSLYKATPNVASAGTLALPVGNGFHITGTTDITTLNPCDATNDGRLVTLIFDDILTLTDGNNLKLAENFVTTTDDAIQLYCDGSNWFQVAPGSVN